MECPEPPSSLEGSRSREPLPWRRDLPGRGAGGQAGGVGPAALPAVDQPLLLQHGQGPADGLAAALEPPAKQLLGGEHLAFAVPPAGDLLAQGVRYKAVFGSHRSILLWGKILGSGAGQDIFVF